MLGLDYSTGRPNLRAVKDAGNSFVSRYLSWLPNPKVILPAERDQILNEGLDISLNWEYDIHDCMGGMGAGSIHGKEAVHQALLLGYPQGSTIYFSGDFDIQDGQLGQAELYWQAAEQHTEGAGYRIGVYGGRRLVGHMLDHGYVDDGWQTRAWSGQPTFWHPHAMMRQVQFNLSVGGASVDINETVGKVYFWNHKKAAPKPQVSEENMLSAFKAIDNDSVYVTDGWKYRPVPDLPAYLNLIDSGLLKKPTTQFSMLDSYGWAVVLGHGESLSGFGGVPA